MFVTMMFSNPKEATMNKLTDQISTAGKGNMEAALKLANLSMDAAIQLTHLQMEAAKAFVAEQSASVQSLGSTTDPRKTPVVSNKSVEKAAEGALDYSRKIYEITAQTQHQIAAVMQERFNAMRQEMQGVMTELLQKSPGGADPAVNAIKDAFASAQQAFDAMSKVAKQGAGAAEANVKAAVSSAAATTKRK
jgi:phasin family protein